MLLPDRLPQRVREAAVGAVPRHLHQLPGRSTDSDHRSTHLLAAYDGGQER
jgi:hypothetical protein